MTSPVTMTMTRNASGDVVVGDRVLASPGDANRVVFRNGAGRVGPWEVSEEWRRVKAGAAGTLAAELDADGRPIWTGP